MGSIVHSDYDIRPWDRQPEETPNAFIAFSAYRDMGPKRTLRSAYHRLNPGSQKFSGTWANWSTLHKWRERAGAFDAWRAECHAEVRVEIEQSEANRIADNAQVHKDNECALAELAFHKAAEILDMPLVRNSFVEQRGGQLIIHKPTLLAPSHLFAAAALMRAASDLGRRGLGIKTEDGESITPEQFRRLFYRHTGEIAPDLPTGALPEPIPNPEEKPSITIPAGDISALSNAGMVADATGNGHSNGNGDTNGNGNGETLPVPGVAPAPIQNAIVRFKPPRDRP